MPQGRIPSPTARDGSSRKRAFSLTVSEDGASVDSAGGRSSRRLSASRVVVNGGAMEDTDSMAAGKARKRAAMARNVSKFTSVCKTLSCTQYIFNVLLHSVLCISETNAGISALNV